MQGETAWVKAKGIRNDCMLGVVYISIFQSTESMLCPAEQTDAESEKYRPEVEGVEGGCRRVKHQAGGQLLDNRQDLVLPGADSTVSSSACRLILPLLWVDL